MSAPDQPVSEPGPDFAADVFERACPSREVVHTVTGRWGALALVALGEGPYRFGALRRRVDGVSERMLAQSLQALERSGFVHREVLVTIPPKVEYSLTPRGEQVAAHLLSLVELIESQMPEILTDQERYDRR
ncbi:winged helix-turn-helix transcriptional regulator [Rhodococcus sp. D2-41]|uniref:winged helix-turn-helix transcriptional regulator n=1 Tax=Speluncibacter jeojiensis TaxID=2710754 RepID=UPI00240F2336|nr:helix-turn-helix domain-containing protein [Rhodococcus sp. D2-41]MDG3009987.1 winged helix-turn-helix transcriptional regulator [Rhodococcus sp. D2-41]